MWRLILKKAPTYQRLGSCSRVSRKLKRAAVAVTTSVALSNPSRFVLSDGFALYACNHGKHLSRISIVSDEKTVAVPDLQCPNLQQRLERCSFRMREASSGIVQACSGLTYLRLERCQVFGQPPHLAPLVALTKLRHLDVHVFANAGKHALSVPDLIRVPSTLLRGLTKLTHLGFGFNNERGAEAWLQDVSRLTKLQELSICQRMRCSASTAPGLGQLTALTSLHLDLVRLHPAVLQDISTQLQRLQLGEGVSLVGPDAAARLLSCIAGMTRLQQLRLSPPYSDQHGQDPPADAAAYTALTASSSLQQLQL
jgi:hypothetical protein